MEYKWIKEKWKNYHSINYTSFFAGVLLKKKKLIGITVLAHRVRTKKNIIKNGSGIFLLCQSKIRKFITISKKGQTQKWSVNPRRPNKSWQSGTVLFCPALSSFDFWRQLNCRAVTNSVRNTQPESDSESENHAGGDDHHRLRDGSSVRAPLLGAPTWRPPLISTFCIVFLSCFRCFKPSRPQRHQAALRHWYY